MPRALIVDDDPGFRLGLADLLQREGYTAATASTGAEGRRELARQAVDLLFVDLNLPDGSGLDLLRAGPQTEAILVTGQASLKVAAEAWRCGARDCLVKPVDRVRLRMTLAALARDRELRTELSLLRGELRALGRFGFLVGDSPAMRGLYETLSAAARTSTPLLLVGERGTGKQLTARTLHRLAGAHGPFEPMARSVAALDERLLLERARGGTLFADELTELPPSSQTVLLRLLQVTGLRVVAATRRDPDQAAAAGSLHPELLSRFAAARILLPPLRERSGDVELLAEHFLARLNRWQGASKRLTRAALDRLLAHPWPGNVPELRDCLRRAFLDATADIDADAVCFLSSRQDLQG